MRPLVLLTGCAVGLLALAGCGSGKTVVPAAASNTGATDRATITTQAIGKVEATPDTLTVYFAVQSSASTAALALSTDNAKAATVIATLKARGVAAKDLQTSGLSLQPQYGSKANVITGYQASEQVTATLRNLATAGSITDAAATAAGNSARVQQLAFSVADDSELLNQARADAVGLARTQAERMAKAANEKLGAVRTITEVPQNGQSFGYSTSSDGVPAAAPSSVPIQPGTQDVTVTLAVTFELG